MRSGLAVTQLDVIQMRSAVERHGESFGTLDEGMMSISQRPEAPKTQPVSACAVSAGEEARSFRGLFLSRSLTDSGWGCGSCRCREHAAGLAHGEDDVSPEGCKGAAD